MFQLPALWAQTGLCGSSCCLSFSHAITSDKAPWVVSVLRVTCVHLFSCSPDAKVLGFSKCLSWWCFTMKSIRLMSHHGAGCSGITGPKLCKKKKKVVLPFQEVLMTLIYRLCIWESMVLYTVAFQSSIRLVAAKLLYHPPWPWHVPVMDSCLHPVGQLQEEPPLLLCGEPLLPPGSQAGTAGFVPAGHLQSIPAHRGILLPSWSTTQC